MNHPQDPPLETSLLIKYEESILHYDFLLMSVMTRFTVEAQRVLWRCVIRDIFFAVLEFDVIGFVGTRRTYFNSYWLESIKMVCMFVCYLFSSKATNIIKAVTLWKGNYQKAKLGNLHKLCNFLTFVIKKQHKLVIRISCFICKI